MKQLSVKRTMERYVLLGSILLFVTATAAPPSHGYRTDYEYSQTTRSYYKIHVESHNMQSAKQICELEGTEVMVPVSKEDLRQAHKMMKKFPDIGKYLWISNEGDKEQHQVAEEDPQMELEMSSDDTWEAIKSSYDCEVMTRSGEIELLGCYQLLPFICKVEEKSAPYDSQCGVYGRGYTYIESVGSCYKVPNMPLKWDGAYDECQAEGAHMLVLNSAAESAAMKSFLEHAPRLALAQTTYFFHVGIRANEPTDGSQRVFRTIFNETLEEAGFSTWSEGEPNNHAGLEQCGTIFSNNGLYNDVECNHLYGFVCEKEVHLTQ